MNEQWNNALDQVDDRYLLEAARYRRNRFWPGAMAGAAAVLVLIIGISIFQPQPQPEIPGKGSSATCSPPEEPAPGNAAAGGFDFPLSGRGEPGAAAPGASADETTYRVTVAGDHPIINQLEPEYAAGETVIIRLETVTEHDYILYVNGVRQEMDREASDRTYTCFTFTMPDEDVVIEIEDRWVANNR